MDGQWQYDNRAVLPRRNGTESPAEADHFQRVRTVPGPHQQEVAVLV